MSATTTPLLTASWRRLVMLNFVCDPKFLESRVPQGVELDLWEGEAFVSLVAFQFRDTRVLGIPIPGHACFEEVNLRFYVRRSVDQESRRGVVFVRELVPRPLVAAVARALYDEPYASASMSHNDDIDPLRGGDLAYRWRFQGHDYEVATQVQGPPVELAKESHEEFIAEHYWGYTKRRNGATSEYQVEHPPWKVWKTVTARHSGDWGALYGDEFAGALSVEPTSAFVAEGSAVCVHRGRNL